MVGMALGLNISIEYEQTYSTKKTSFLAYFQSAEHALPKMLY